VGIATETLHAKQREVQGTRACRRLRQEGQVPAVLYGHKEATVPIQVSAEELETAVRRRSRMFELHLGPKHDVVLLKELQYDSFGDEVIHADFVRIAMDETLSLEVPILLKGVPKIEHTVLQQTLANVEIECLPKDIPEAIVAQVGDMVEGESRKVGLLVAPEGVKILTDPEVIFATLTTIIEEVVAAAPAPEEGAVGEPEIIGRKLGDEGEEEAAEGEEKPKAKEKKE
jgi:large subunit ribosomal protein L25